MESSIKCFGCKEEKSATEEFFNKSQLKSSSHLCKECKAKTDKLYRQKNRSNILDKQRKHYKENKTKILQEQKIYNKSRKEELAKYQSTYWQKNKEELKAYRTAWRKANWETRKQQHQERYDNDPCYKILFNTRTRIRSLLKKSNGIKDCATLDLLGGDLEQAKKHIESLFQEGMNWNNHGMYGWHIDHIKPCVSFDLTNPEELKKCFHYTNLQPLWATDNLSKGTSDQPSETSSSK